MKKELKKKIPHSDITVEAIADISHRHNISKHLSNLNSKNKTLNKVVDLKDSGTLWTAWGRLGSTWPWDLQDSPLQSPPSSPTS
jgi:hypothetical protein